MFTTAYKMPTKDSSPSIPLSFHPRMQTPRSPFHIQELLHHCIGPLSGSKSDLKSCALVSRSWVNPAQTRLFMEVETGEGSMQHHQQMWSQLLEILRRSPHLILHIRRLRIRADALSDEMFSQICRFPFTHLERLVLPPFELSLSSALAIQQVLSLSTLRHVDMYCHFNDQATFFQMWHRCSPSVRSLALRFFQRFNDPFVPMPHSGATSINLEFFEMTSMHGIIQDWLPNDICPFNFAHLRVLSVGQYTELLLCDKFAAALRTIEAFSFELTSMRERPNLSLIPNLASLRMSITRATWSRALDTFSTIPTWNHLRDIQICGHFDEGSCSKLDLLLGELLRDSFATIELLPTVPSTNPVTYFPKMNAKRMIHTMAYHQDWFKNHIAML
ncbi:hypothetical protein DFH07DRAFT_151212 [Mycena maculata]|uniref:F-box domain-containing protein n=1 Tax=Mycena maculata TaxID=230809 RepID=A0AAD7HZE1_9AGAR|nr:hypothetical protein DFH07DRAFT_151212 [Mycena maculata]